jgi:hypothetical protein
LFWFKSCTSGWKEFHLSFCPFHMRTLSVPSM